MHAKGVHTYTCSRSCSPCQNLVDYGNNKIIQRALTGQNLHKLKMDSIQEKKENVCLLSVLITHSWLLVSVLSLQRREDWTSLQLCLSLDWRLTHMTVLTSQRSDHEAVCSTWTLNIIQLFHLWPIYLFRFFISSHRRHTTKDLNVQMEKKVMSKVYCPAKGPLLWNLFGCHKKNKK